MAAVIGSMFTRLEIDGNSFARGLHSAGGRVNTFERRTNQSLARVDTGFSRLQSGFGSLAATLATRGLAAAGGVMSIQRALNGARDALREFDQISKQARTFGVTGEFYQSISFGAMEASVEQAKVNTALETFTRLVGQAHQQSGALYSQLRQSNPELLRAILAAQTQEERIRLVADAMNRMTSATDRAALASAAFGRGGIELTRVLAGGTAAIDDMTRRAREMGIIIPEDLLTRSEELENRLGILALVTKRNLQTALVELAPVLVKIAEGMASFATGVNSVTQAINELTEGASWQRLARLMSTLQDLPNMPGGHLLFAALEKVFGSLADDVERNAETIRGEIDSIIEKIDELDAKDTLSMHEKMELERAIDELARLRNELQSVEEQAARMAGNGGRAIDDLTRSATEAGDEIASVADGIDGLEDKTVHLTVKTRYETEGGPVDVTRHIPPQSTHKPPPGMGGHYADMTNPGDHGFTTNPMGTGGAMYVIPKAVRRSVPGFKDGGQFSGEGGPKDDKNLIRISDGEFIVNAESTKKYRRVLEAINNGTIRSFANGGATSGEALAQTFGSNWLRLIEDNTRLTIEELRTHTGYLQVIESDGQAALSALKDIARAMGSLRSMGSGGGGAGTGTSAAEPSGPNWSTAAATSGPVTASTSPALGFSSSSSGDRKAAFDYNHPESPYHYRAAAHHAVAGIKYDPIADFMFNGNWGALDKIQDHNLRRALEQQGPRVGQRNYGSQVNITANPDFTVVGDGWYHMGGGVTDAQRQQAEIDYQQARAEVGFNTGGYIHPGDSQQVSFFKNPQEAVAIFRPDQVDAITGAMEGGRPGRGDVNVGPITIQMPAGSEPLSPQSLRNLEDRFSRAVRNAMADPY